MFSARSLIWCGLPDPVLPLCLLGVSGSFLLATVGLLGGLWPVLSQLSVDWRDRGVREGEGDTRGEPVLLPLGSVTFRQEKKLGLTCFSEGEEGGTGGFGSFAGL